MPIVLAGIDPYVFYAAALGAAALAGTGVFLLSNVAVMRYMHITKAPDNAFHRIVLPVVAGLGLFSTLLLTLFNFDILTGGSATMSTILIIVTVALFVAGIVLAASLKQRKPEIYQRIGRQ
jgi:hypothetical protein